MSLRATSRLVTAVLVAVGGLMLAVLAGRAEAAVLAVPWIALLVLGLSGARADRVWARLTVDADRVVVGQPVTIEITVDGLDGGWVEAVWQPPPSFVTPTRGLAGRTGAAAGSDDGVGSGSAGTGGPGDTDNGSDDGAAEGSGTEADTDAGTEPEGWPAVGEVAGPSGRAELRAQLSSVAWGSHDVGRVELRIHHRFGLTVGHGLARQSLPIRVHPHPIDLRRLLTPWHVRRLSGAHRSRAASRGVEYADIRPFGPGDSPRDINWRASARSEELLVSQRHPDRSTHALLLIDSFGDSGYDLPAVLGETIEAALAVAESHLSVSDRVGLIDLGGVIRWVTPGSGRHHLQRLVDALLATRLFHSEADRSVTTIPSRALPPRSFILAISPLVDGRFIDALFALRAAGHDVAAVELSPGIDPTSPRWDRTEAAGLALRLWQAERELTRGRLAEVGVAVARRQLGGPLDPDAVADDAEAWGGAAGDPLDQTEPWDVTLGTLAAARRRLGPLLRT